VVPSWKDDSVHYSTHFIQSILDLQSISTSIELRAAVPSDSQHKRGEKTCTFFRRGSLKYCSEQFECGSVVEAVLEAGARSPVLPL